MNKTLKIVLALSVIVILFVLIRDNTSLEYLKDRKKLEDFIKSVGILAPVAYIVLYSIVTVSCISALPVTLAGGVVFGPLMGVIYTMIGASIGLCLSFLISRYVAKDYIENKFKDSEIYKKIDKGIKEKGWVILAVTRLLPIFPFGIQNYIYGLTSISFFKYSILSILFILPGTSVFVMLAGAIASGDINIAMKYSIIASLIILFLIVIVKFITKKVKY